MSFIKAHLIPLLCALVVVLALGALFIWPLSSYSATLKERMESRIKVMEVIRTAGIQPIVIPGLPPFNGPITDAVITARKTVQAQMHDMAEHINQLASKQNESNRIIRRDNVVIPLLDGNPQPNYLPEVRGVDPNDFTDAYMATFDRWTSLLVKGSKVPPENFDALHSGAAPDKTEVEAAWEVKRRKDLARLPTLPNGQVMNIPGSTVGSSAEMLEFMHGFVGDRAAGIRMYATRDCFQVRRPTDTAARIFEAFVDSWLQMDVVHTIDALNSEALDKLPAEERNVGRAPIKRLVHIAVGDGVGGATTSANLFAPEKPGTAGLDYARSLTGRASTDKYDITNVAIVLDLDPSSLNKFIATLYTQNNSYTVLGVKLATVDPFVAASDGYLYGSGQVVRAEIQVEAILFRPWTREIIPAGFGNSGAGPGVPGGPPGAGRNLAPGRRGS